MHIGGNYISNLYKELSDKRIDLLTLIFLSILILISRIPFMSKYLYDWDSIGYALAFQNYNISLHQPHPPGYIFYVASSKAVNIFFNDPNFSMIFLSILFSILTVFMIYFLGKKMFFWKLGLIASVLLVFNPIFWFYGDIASSYMVGAFFASLVAYTSYQASIDKKFIYISAVTLGLAGGFRQDMLLFMFPLWIYCITRKQFDYKQIFMSLIVLIMSILAWLIPTIILAGGYETYSLVSITLLLNSFSISSVFFGAEITSNIDMGMNLLGWTIYGMGNIGSFIVIAYFFYRIKTVKLSFIKNSKAIFLALWITPAFLFYFLVYFGKPGYILVYVPSLSIILAYVLIEVSKDLNIKFKSISKNYYLIFLISLCVISGILQFNSPSEEDTDYGRIHSEDMKFYDLNQSLMEFNSRDTIIFMLNDDIWRKLQYYSPDYEIYSVYKRTSAGKTYVGLRQYKNDVSEVYESDFFVIVINSSKTKILWVIDDNSKFLKDLKSRIEVKSLKTPDGKIVYYSEVKNMVNFQIYNLAFIIE